MTIKQRIAEYLKRHPEGVDDDMLAQVLGLSARQQANSRCRELEKEGLVSRRKVHGKIHNFWIGGEDVVISLTKSASIGSGGLQAGQTDIKDNWYWEGNIQAQVVSYLADQGCLIRSVADTAKRQRGKDIVAESDGVPLWVSVKGYPTGTTKTHPSTQAGHWFKQAIFDLLEYRGENEYAILVIAMPDYQRYRDLAKKIEWLQPVAKFSYYWVQEDGTVNVE